MCAIISRIYRGIKSGAYYAVTSGKPVHIKLHSYCANLHKISSPANVFNMGVVFFFMLAIYTFTTLPLAEQLLSAYFTALASSTGASERWQVWINRGANKPDYDDNEDPYTEWFIGYTRSNLLSIHPFETDFFGIKYNNIYYIRIFNIKIPVGFNIWVYRGYTGKTSKWLYLITLIELFAGLYPLIFLL